jgi:hypothetical protein
MRLKPMKRFLLPATAIALATPAFADTNADVVKNWLTILGTHQVTMVNGERVETVTYSDGVVFTVYGTRQYCIQNGGALYNHIRNCNPINNEEVDNSTTRWEAFFPRRGQWERIDPTEPACQSAYQITPDMPTGRLSSPMLSPIAWCGCTTPTFQPPPRPQPLRLRT